MPNIVEIIIRATTGQATTEMNKFGKGLNTAVQELTGFNVASLATVGGLVALGKGILDNNEQWVEYNKTIREMTQVTGLGAEEISRIVQVGDDWGISIETIRTALSYMNKQGVTPSIELLAQLADSYVAAGDKSQWAQENAKLLGRNYQALIPLFAQGGDALRKNTAAVDANLIANGKTIKQSRELEVAQDNLTDKVTGLKNELARGLIPVETKTVDALAMGVEISKEFSTILSLLKQRIIGVREETAKNAEELDAMAKSHGLVVGAIEETDEELAANREMMAKSTESVDESTLSLNRFIDTTPDYVKAYREQIDAADKARQTNKEFFDGINMGIDSTVDNWLKKMEWIEGGGLELEKKFAEIYSSIESGGPAALAKMEPELETLKVKIIGLKTNLGEIDATEAAQNIKETLGVSLSDAYIILEKVREDANFDVQSYVRVHYSWDGDPGPGTQGGRHGGAIGDGEEEGRAGGGPVLSGHSYLVGENGPEILTMGRNGGMVQPITNNYNLTIHSQAQMENVRANIK